jgi:hypothetical protein
MLNVMLNLMRTSQWYKYITKYFFGFALFRGARLLLDVVFGDFVVP